MTAQRRKKTNQLNTRLREKGNKVQTQSDVKGGGKITKEGIKNRRDPQVKTDF